MTLIYIFLFRWSMLVTDILVYVYVYKTARISL